MAMAGGAFELKGADGYGLARGRGRWFMGEADGETGSLWVRMVDEGKEACCF